jgi:hypothetical protein
MEPTMNERTAQLVQPPDSDALPGVYQFLAERAVAALAFDGEVNPTLLMLSVPPGATEPAAVCVMDPRLVFAMHRDQSGKEALMALVRSLLDTDHPVHASVATQMNAHPNLIVHISESWMVCKPLTEGGEALEGYKGSLADHPDRTEAITTALHTLRGTLIGTCPMTRDASGKPSAVIEPLWTDAEGFRGRFTVNNDSRELPHHSIELVAVPVERGITQ